MPNPQQHGEAVAGGLDGQREIPPENQPGHHPADEQDKPDLDKFAAKLGTMPPEERDDVLADEPGPGAGPGTAPAPASRRNSFVGVAAVAALVALIVAVVTGRRRRSR